MSIHRAMGAGFLLTAALIAAVGLVSLRTTSQVDLLRWVELPMEQSLREVEVSLWESIHAADAFRLTADPLYRDLYVKQRQEIDEFFAEYRELAASPEERIFAQRFDTMWTTAQGLAEQLIDLTQRQREVEARVYERVELADRVIDFEIQAALEPGDPHLVAKERRIREVEVSIWEMLHALNQFVGLTPTASVGGEAVNFGELMEQQITDVEEEWAAYLHFTDSRAETAASRRFELLWSGAVMDAREVRRLHSEAVELFGDLYATIDELDDVVDFDMQDFIGQRVAARDETAEDLRATELGLLVLVILLSGLIAVVTSRRITQHVRARERLEEELRHSQKLEAVGRLAGGIAHDFNNLLQSIRGNAALALEELGDDTSARHELEAIGEATGRAAALTRQLLAFSRSQEVRLQVLDLNSVVLGASKLLRRLIGKDVELVTLLGAELPGVLGDAGQLEQVLMNLAVNARDAMPEGGRIVFETRAVSSAPAGVLARAGESSPQHVRLSVTDDGAGMDAHTLEHIFEPFFTTKPQGKGTGLGLATVYGVVKQYGGEIVVDSTVGQGTAFHIQFPAAEGVSTTLSMDEPTPPAPAATGHETILVAEDEPEVRRLVARILGRNGYAVLEAENGEEALRVAELHGDGIDLLLSDVVMPLMGGVELARSFAVMYPGTPVVHMSGYSEEDPRAPGPDRAVDPLLLEKPFDAPALLRTVREMLDRSVARV